MFGRYTDSPGSVMSIETTKVLQISKADYVNILRQDSVFLLNYLNMLSVNGQKSFGGVLALTTGSIEERIAFWVVALTQGTATEITIECRQRDLYSVFGVQRTSFISALESMKNRGLIDFMPDRIIIKNRRDMVDVLRRIP
jgi:CRP-like cAMP-binding protein